MNKIIIDTREKITSQYARGKIKYITKKLDYGDIKIFNQDETHSITIERKTFADCYTSYFDGRLRKQMRNMSEHEEYPVLLITGSFEDSINNIPNIQYINVAEKVISDAVIRYGFRSVIWVTNKMPDVDKKGSEIAVKIMSGVADKLDTFEPLKKANKYDPAVEALTFMYNIKTPAAKNLLEYFGTFKKILYCTEKDLKQIVGIGEISIKRIMIENNKRYNV